MIKNCGDRDACKDRHGALESRGQQQSEQLRLVAHFTEKNDAGRDEKSFHGDSREWHSSNDDSVPPARGIMWHSVSCDAGDARESPAAGRSTHFFGLGENAMQWPCGLILPSTILQVPRSLAVLPAMYWLQSSQSLPSSLPASTYCNADLASLLSAAQSPGCRDADECCARNGTQSPLQGIAS